MTFERGDAKLEEMRVFPVILFSFLLLACDNKEESAPAPQVPATPPAPQLPRTCTKEEKAALARQATGIEKLLRTDSFEYDCSLNKAAWNDDEFFRRYAEALNCDMESFLKETFEDEHVIETLGAEEIADDSATARKSISALVNAARDAYTAALAWCTANTQLNSSLNNEDVLAGFRLLLRQRLLQDLFILSGGSQCYWCSGISENPDLESVVKLPMPHFEGCILERAAGGETPEYMKYNSLVTGRLENLVKSYRTFIVDSCYYNMIHTLVGLDQDTTSPETDNAVKAFHAAECAWDTYQKAIATAHAPIYNSFVGGSGTGEFNTRFQVDMLLSQMQYLGYIAKSAAGSPPASPEPIDFTASEDTPEAAEERNNQPG
ncbi:MAG: hypothetical protein IKA23_06100 [Akkermansia sp.]|nr:hypothetical protein [Akkermansia sp.]MBR2314115.1 hypothetical protein [Akkermansia sp.]